LKYAKIDATTIGSTTVVAAVANKRILVLQYTATASVNLNAYFTSNSTAITGPLYLGSHGTTMAAYGAMTPAGLVGLFRTEIGEPLNIFLSGSGNAGGHITYMVTD
jgi:hypothetical protein